MTPPTRTVRDLWEKLHCISRNDEAWAAIQAAFDDIKEKCARVADIELERWDGKPLPPSARDTIVDAIRKVV